MNHIKQLIEAIDELGKKYGGKGVVRIEGNFAALSGEQRASMITDLTACLEQPTPETLFAIENVVYSLSDDTLLKEYAKSAIICELEGVALHALLKVAKKTSEEACVIGLILYEQNSPAALQHLGKVKKPIPEAALAISSLMYSGGVVQPILHDAWLSKCFDAPQPNVVSGILYFNQKDLVTAWQRFKTAFEMRPERKEVFEMYVSCCLKLGGTSLDYNEIATDYNVTPDEFKKMLAKDELKYPVFKRERSLLDILNSNA